MKTKKFPIFFVTSVLFMPRFTLIDFAQSSIRLEDLLFILNGIWLLQNRELSKKYLSDHMSLFKVVLCIVGAGLLSSTFWFLLGKSFLLEGILFSIRPLEYLTILPTCFYLIENDFTKIPRMLKWFTIMVFSSSALQFILGYEFGVSRFGFSRAAGLTGGPYELAMIATILSLYWIARQEYILFTISVLTILFSLSRVSILAIVLSFTYLVFQRRIENPKISQNSKSTHKSILFFLMSSIIFLTFIIYAFSPLESGLGQYLSRIQSTQAGTVSFAQARQLASTILPISNSAQYKYQVFINPPNFAKSLNTGDSSSGRRYFVWNVLVNTTNNNGAALIGLGPGFFGSAVDGNYVRIYGELGLFGLFLYFKWIKSLWRPTHSIFRSQIVALCVTALFIDIFTSLKAVVLIYVMFAVVQPQLVRKLNSKIL
jgi:hypothetical protein